MSDNPLEEQQAYDEGSAETGKDQLNDYWRKYWSRAPAVEEDEKAVQPKSKAFEIVMKVDPQDSRQTVVIVCNPYRPDRAETIRQIHRPKPYIRLLREKFQSTGATEVSTAEQMHPSSIIGWTDQNGNNFVNQTDLGPASDEDVIPLSDTIFPVFVMGFREMPVTLEAIHNYLLQYEPGMYLILEYDNTVQTRETLVSIYKPLSLYRKTVVTQEAVLAVHLSYTITDPTTGNPITANRPMGVIDRILDSNNEAFPVYGMYAGGPLPPEPHRLAWDLPPETDYKSYGFSSMLGAFRHEISRKKSDQRIGYFCSNDGLLFLTERRKVAGSGQRSPTTGEPAVNEYRSLLKNSTFVIVDGYSEYHLYYAIPDIQETYPFKQVNPYDPLEPEIVVIPEGLSSVTIIENINDPSLRSSWYYHQSPYFPPILLSWKLFQRDFGSTADIFGSLHVTPGPKPPKLTPVSSYVPHS